MRRLPCAANMRRRGPVAERRRPLTEVEDPINLAHSSRGWTGARTPSAIKRVRQAARRRAINQPRRSAAKTLVTKAVEQAAAGSPEQARDALVMAISALDRAAKTGAIHRNAADRRKSRLTLKINAALEGVDVAPTGKVSRTTGKAAAAKQARARIAASKATKSKGAQTAAGKAREALAKTSRGANAQAAGAEEAPAAAEGTTTTRAASSRSTRTSAAKSTPAKAKSPRKSTAKADTAAKPRASKTTKKS